MLLDTHNTHACRAKVSLQPWQAPTGHEGDNTLSNSQKSWLQVEVLLQEFWDPSSGPVFAEEGDQQRFWKLTRRFIESLAAGGDYTKVKAVSHASLQRVACSHATALLGQVA